MLARILTSWSLDPTVLAGLVLVTGFYWWLTRRGDAQRKDGHFALLLLLSILALESPIDFLADRYLFSVHMVQHLLLVLAIAPLLAVCFPSARAHVPAWLLRPAPSFMLFNLDLWVWHLPPLYEATLRSEPLHVLEHLTFVATACLFWWVAFDARRPVLLRLAYVFLAATASSLLGALITFASSVLYPTYLHALESPGFGRQLELEWGVNALSDQELGGLLMWVPGGFVYLVFLVAIFIGWSSRTAAAETVPAHA
jgi:putative membrane protein